MNIKLNIDGKEYEVVSKEQKQQKELPKTWEEARIYIIDCFWGKKYYALRKLEILRDIYNDGWKPDWTNVSLTKYCIYRVHNHIKIGQYHSEQRFLHFKTEELRDEFLNNFRELINEAKDLL